MHSSGLFGKAIMKPIRASFLLSLIVLSCLTLTGCQTAAPRKQARFSGSEKASIVIQYSSWDYIFMTKPLYREGEFLRQIHRPELAGVFDQMNVNRETAVVSLGWQYDKQTLQELLVNWKQLLRECRFQRVVFVRGNNNKTVERAIIIEDANLIAGNTPAASTLVAATTP
jgi:hypothetical protein